jgi:hypothetical protein
MSALGVRLARSVLVRCMGTPLQIAAVGAQQGCIQPVMGGCIDMHTSRAALLAGSCMPAVLTW